MQYGMSLLLGSFAEPSELVSVTSCNVTASSRVFMSSVFTQGC